MLDFTHLWLWVWIKCLNAIIERCVQKLLYIECMNVDVGGTLDLIWLFKFKRQAWHRPNYFLVEWRIHPVGICRLALPLCKLAAVRRVQLPQQIGQVLLQPDGSWARAEPRRTRSALWWGHLHQLRSEHRRRQLRELRRWLLQTQGGRSSVKRRVGWGRGLGTRNLQCCALYLEAIHFLIIMQLWDVI